MCQFRARILIQRRKIKVGKLQDKKQEVCQKAGDKGGESRLPSFKTQEKQEVYQEACDNGVKNKQQGAERWGSNCCQCHKLSRAKNNILGTSENPFIVLNNTPISLLQNVMNHSDIEVEKQMNKQEFLELNKQLGLLLQRLIIRFSLRNKRRGLVLKMNRNWKSQPWRLSLTNEEVFLLFLPREEERIKNPLMQEGKKLPN